MKYYYFVGVRFKKGTLYYGKQSFCERAGNIADAWTVEEHGYKSSSGVHRLKNILKTRFPENDIKVFKVKVVRDN